MTWLDARSSQLGSTSTKEPVVGTCQWIDYEEKFRKWRFSENSAGLWIFGKPGNVHSHPQNTVQGS